MSIANQTSAKILKRDARFIGDAIKMRYTPFVLAGGEGSRLIDPEGRRFLDFSAIWSLANLGYSERRVRDAVVAQLDRTMVSGLNSTVNIPAGELAERLVELTPGAFEKKVWFGLSGSDASEAAQRLILRQTGKRRIISFIGSWHGTTDATMALSGHPAFSSFGSAAVTKVPYPNPYRNPFGGDAKNVTDQCLGFLEEYLFRTVCPPEDVAAIFVEGVQADSGDVVPPPDFLPKLRALCDRHDILLVLDEVKVGLGRTGAWYSYQHGGIAADVTLLGKSLGGGLPLSAIVARSEVLDVGTGLALYTISGNATSCAAGLATIDVIERDGLVARSAIGGARLSSGLQALRRYDQVGDVRGLGMICGVELVEDRTSKKPDQRMAAKVVYRAWQLGLIVFYAGMWGNVIEITPPLILDDAEIDEGIAILDQAIADVLDGRVSDDDIATFAGW